MMDFSGHGHNLYFNLFLTYLGSVFYKTNILFRLNLSLQFRSGHYLSQLKLKIKLYNYITAHNNIYCTQTCYYCEAIVKYTVTHVTYEVSTNNLKTYSANISFIHPELTFYNR